MLLPKYGIKTAIIGDGEYLIKCPHCECDTWSDILVISNYYHFFYVPIFPLYKDVTIFCKKCGLRRYGAPFNSTVFSDFSEVKRHYHNPWYTYIGITIATLFILLCVTFAIIGAISGYK